MLLVSAPSPNGRVGPQQYAADQQQTFCAVCVLTRRKLSGAHRAVQNASFPCRWGLLLHEIGVARHALPLVVLIDPHVSKATTVVKRFGPVCTSGVVSADNNGGISVQMHAYVTIGHQARRIERIFDVSQEARLVHYGPVVVRIDESVPNQTF
jgi:hypothetical protein